MMSINNVIRHRGSSENKYWCIVKRALMPGVPLSFKLRRMTKPSRERTLDTTVSGSSQFYTDDHLVPQLPSALWTDEIFSYLDRSGQNRLAEAHPDVALWRRQHWHDISMDWPLGKVKTKPSLPINKVVFSPDTQQLCVVHAYKAQVKIYDKFRGLQHVLNASTNTAVADASFAPDGSILATAGQSDGTIRLWKRSETSLPNDTKEKDREDSYSCFKTLKVQQYGVTMVKWSRHAGSRKVLCSLSQDGLVCILDIDEGITYTRHWKTRRDVSECRQIVAFGPGDTLAYARNNEHVHLWNWKDNTVRLLRDLDDVRGKDNITSLAYSPDGKTLAVGCQVATIKLWTLTLVNGAEVNGSGYDYVFSQELHLGDGGWSFVTLLTFSPDGRFLACCNDGSQIRIVDMTDGQIMATFNGHKARIESLCFTSDGRTLTSGARDRSVRLWDTSRLCCGGGVRLQEGIQ
jgi:WD40 repeat protein